MVGSSPGGGGVGASASGGGGGVGVVVDGFDGQVIITWTPTPAISNICFPAGTPITSDQGPITIECLKPHVHTIHGQPLLHITQTVTLDSYLICFEKHALYYNCPNQRTLMTKDHQIEFNGQLVPAERFLHYSTKVKKVKYSGEILYNVLLANYGTMVVNNLVCETLHPKNIIAKLYTGKFSEARRQNLIMQLNTSLRQGDLPTYKSIVHTLQHGL